MSDKLILAVDQGTSGTKTVIFDDRGRIVAKATSELKSYYPAPGFVEQNPDEIYKSVLDSVKKCLSELDKSGGSISDISACGISNQRETFVLWNDHGEPLCNAVVWQCKRSVDICSRLKSEGLEKEIVERTGLIIDPYFSGTKLLWLYENDSRVRDAFDGGNAYFGTVDTWLLYRLTNGSHYYTDHTNASRTLLFNINDMQWDSYLLDAFHLQNLNLPDVLPSSSTFGESDFNGLFPGKLRITGMIGDSHAAAFGEGCFTPGTAKATLGTGSSILMNTGGELIRSKSGMMTTVCWSTPDRIDYALEGIIVSAGSTIKWLRDQIGLFAESSDTEGMAEVAGDNNGVYVIPAFSGLGAPHWKMDARGTIIGLTFGSTKNHIVRAALESIPYQIKDVIVAMESDSSIPLSELKADGGITSNIFVMNFLADLLGVDVVNIGMAEVSALGAAFMAGLEAGVFESIESLNSLRTNINHYAPGPDAERARKDYEGWKFHIGNLMK
ncbi:FGGY family carbohydrate kinase [Candidatus Latescibacterota bacterium]